MAVLNKIYPPKVVANEIKKHVVNYTKGRRGAKQLIVAVMQTSEADGIVRLAEEFFNQKNN